MDKVLKCNACDEEIEECDECGEELKVGQSVICFAGGEYHFALKNAWKHFWMIIQLRQRHT